MFKRTALATAAAAAIGGWGLLAAANVNAQEAPSPSNDSAQRVEITGSSIKRVDAETALPVTVLRREDIDRTGATTAQDLMSLIPANFGGTVVANNVGAPGQASTANLRSLGSKYTLVLLNGRRVANYAFGNSPVDLNSIPVSAIERVEVLRDGASSLYGADAVAGVINFILKKNYQGFEATVYGTDVENGGGNVNSFNLTGGYGNPETQHFNVLLSLNHEEDQSLKATQRAFGATADRPDLGINNASPRNGIPNLNFMDTSGNFYGAYKPTGTGVTLPGPNSPVVQNGINPYAYNGCNAPGYALVPIDATTCGTDYVQFIDLVPKQHHDNVVARGTYEVNDNTELYAEATYTKDTTWLTYSPAPYTVQMQYPGNGRFYPSSITVPKGATLPAGYTMPDGSVLASDTVLQNDITVTPTGPITGTWRTVAGGGREDITHDTNERFLGGIKGNYAGWDYDGAVTYSQNKGEIDFGPGQYSYALLTPLMNAGDINIFGQQDDTSLAALQSAALTGMENTGLSKSQELDFHVSHELFQLPAGMSQIAVGIDARHESLEQISGPGLISGDQVGGNGPVPDVSGSRKVYGAYTEIEAPITKQLDSTWSARYDDYKNSFGTSFNRLSPKVQLRFQPMKDLLLRGSYGQGFRAPTLYENLRPFTDGNNTNANWNDPIRCPNNVPVVSSNTVDRSSECEVQLFAAVSGNPDLKPEKSKQWSLGFVAQPFTNLTAEVDYWDVRIADAIGQLSEIAVLSNPQLFNSQYFRTAPDGSVVQGNYDSAGNPLINDPLAYVYLPYQNTARTFAAGIDYDLTWRQKFAGAGVLTVNADGTYFTRHGYQYNDVESVSDLGSYKDFGAVPRWRQAVTVAFATPGWNVSVTDNFTAHYHDYTNPTITPSADYPADRMVGSYNTVDTQLTLKPIKNMDFTLGVRNLLDTEPPSSRTGQNFQTGYDATYTNPVDRMYYARLRYKFY